MSSEWYKRIKVIEAIIDNTTMYYLVDEDFNFIPYVKEYLDTVAARAVREVTPNTIKTYCYLLRHFIIYLRINNLKILDLDGKPELLSEFKVWLNNPFRYYENISVIELNRTESDMIDELSPTTVNSIIRSVSTFYNYLYIIKKIKNSPVIYRNVAKSSRGVERDILAHTRRNHSIRKNNLVSKVISKPPKVLSSKDFKVIYDIAQSLRNKIILLILLDGGLRSGELLGIKLEDIDFGQQGIWVRFRPNNINKSRAKSGYGGDRLVDFPVRLMALIDEYISTEWINSNPSNDFLFVVTKSAMKEYNGQPMKKSTLDSIFKHLSKKSGIKIHPHMLRHTHATELARMYIEKGEPINWKYIQARLGHNSVVTTMEIYAHLEHQDYKKEYSRLKNKSGDLYEYNKNDYR